jgi:L-ascorbate metabolism protein UlaG (beta-lactamase superfamily)
MRSAASPLEQLAQSEVAEEQVGLMWLGQSGFALRMGGATVLVDPFLSAHPDRRFPPLLQPAEAQGVDVIACTHEHWDHLDPDSLPALCAASPRSRVVVPAPIVGMVTRLGIAPERVLGMQPDRSVSVANITIHAIPACHGVHPEDAYTFGREFSDGLYRYLGYVFEGGGASVYHAGDTIRYEDLGPRLRERKVDLCLVPINGRDPNREARDIVGNLDGVEAAELAIEAGADVVVPMHYDMFAANLGYPEQLVAALQRLGSSLSVVVPARGHPFVYTRPQKRR